jgi:hypothetical protein
MEEGETAGLGFVLAQRAVADDPRWTRAVKPSLAISLQRSEGK